MKRLWYVLACCLCLAACSQAQSPDKVVPTLIGGDCEGCEAVLDYDQTSLNWTDTLPDFHAQGMKISLSGVIYQPDGLTPAAGVTMYLYHTDQDGLYPASEEAAGWERRHGNIRGWVRTDEDGRYAFYTLRPQPYPSRTEAAHIHATILEPTGEYYYIDSYVFEGDSLLSDAELHPHNPRGGSGLISLQKSDGIWHGKRDIVLRAGL